MKIEKKSQINMSDMDKSGSEAIGQFKVELHSGNAQCGSKYNFFCSVWPWNLIDDREKE